VKDDWLSEIAEKITIDCLPENYQEIARIAGKEAALKLSQYLGGTRFYYPKLDSLLRKERDEQIRQEFNGANHRELARKYDLTETRIRDIVQRKPVPQQIELF